MALLGIATPFFVGMLTGLLPAIVPVRSIHLAPMQQNDWCPTA
ncbi:hypothetical protein [Oculatella sp. LEGE 06141]|nr:hypothetical protein [Oculatella sp. LEGE 06141]